jgi:hypothetical protein
VWLEVGSVKVALSRPAHQRVTPAVSQPRKLCARFNKQSLIFIVLGRNIRIWGKAITNDNCVIEDNVRIGHPNPREFSQAIQKLV